MEWWNAHLEFFDKNGDPRVKEKFMMSSPIPTILVASIYALSVIVLGPKLMAKRQPFKLRKTIIGYNTFEVLFSTYLFHEHAVFWFGEYNWTCQPVDYSNDPNALRIMNAFYLYYLSKFVEFLDTIFFVLRKNNHQITLLHVIHHTSIPCTVWIAVKFTPGGHATFFAFMNSFIHIIMYTYYMLAALLPPHLRKFLWWKRYLTVLQMVQFASIFFHVLQLQFIHCDYNNIILYIIVANAIMFFALFYNFYGKSYSQDKLNDAVENMCVPKKRQRRQKDCLNCYYLLG